MSARVLFWVLLILVSCTSASPLYAQNPFDVLRLFGGAMSEPAIEAAGAEWRGLPPPQLACIELELQRTDALAIRPLPQDAPRRADECTFLYLGVLEGLRSASGAPAVLPVGDCAGAVRLPGRQ